MSPNPAERPTLHYFQDTLCGWCYGFGPTIMRIADEWSEHLDIVVYSGGMITGDNTRALSEMADFIREARMRVEETTGVSFGDTFLHGLLTRQDIMLDSEPPARALETMRAMRPENVIPFSHRLQSALYADGMDMNSEETYRKLATEAGLDPDHFVQVMNSSDIHDAVADEFEYVTSLGIGGFPTVLLEIEDNVHMLAHGYAPFDHIDTMLQSALRG
ncbi:MAG: DsbA family protein [Ignavibacteria bacterium]